MMARREIAEIIISPAYYHGDGKSALATHRPLGPAIPPAVYVPSPAQLGAATEQPLHKSLAKTHSLPIEEGITRPRDISRTPQHFPPQAYAAELSGPSNRDRGVVREPPCAENESVKTVATTSSGAARKEDRTRGGSWAEHASLMSTGNHPQVISIVHKEPVDYEPDDGHGDDGDSALSLIVRFSLLVPLFSIPAAIYALIGLLIAVLISPLRLCTLHSALGETTFQGQLCNLLSPALHIYERIAGIHNPLQHPKSTQTRPTDDEQLTMSTPVYGSNCTPQQQHYYYSANGLTLVLIVSPVLSIGLLLAIWIAAFFWLFNMVLGDSDGLGRRDEDGRAAVLGVCRWWRVWLGKARTGKGESR